VRVEQHVRQQDIARPSGPHSLAGDLEVRPAGLDAQVAADPALPRLPVEHLGAGREPRLFQIGARGEPSQAGQALSEVPSADGEMRGDSALTRPQFSLYLA
jgi:hypothetical protein